MAEGVIVHSGGKSNLPSEFKDPFIGVGVKRVTYEFNNRRSSMFRENKFHEATVYLENGNSSGKQDFYDDDPETLRKRVENFINNLK